MEEERPRSCGSGQSVHVAAVGDLHCSRNSHGALEPLLRQVNASADVLVICGDLTSHGLVEEAKVLVQELSTAAKLPILTVLGNHDYESGQAAEIRKVLVDAGISVLDGEAKEVCGVGFAGVKGFGGGFGRATLSAFGEPAMKDFVQEAVQETMKLENALQQLRTPRKLALLHYSPIRDTVEGEPVEIFPWLGCSRLEEPLNRYQVTAALHGHAHCGSPEGHTSTGVPVYNVAMHVMRKAYPDHPPFRLLTVPVAAAVEPSAPTGEPVETHVH